MDKALPLYATYEHKGFNGLWLKILGFALTLIDHIGLIFSPQLGATATKVLRIIGRPAFPIFVFLALEGTYKTSNYKKYFLRLIGMAILLDGVSYILHYAWPEFLGGVTPGNVFTDLALGSLTIYLLNRKDRWSWLAVLPAAFLILSDFSVYHSPESGFIEFIIVSDYGTFGLLIFLSLHLAHLLTDYYGKRRAKEFDLEVADLDSARLRRWLNVAQALALFLLEMVFELLAQIDTTFILLPSLSLGGMALESWSVLALIPFLFYDGRPGVVKKPLRYALYAFYPVHLLLLGLVSLAF